MTRGAIKIIIDEIDRLDIDTTTIQELEEIRTHVKKIEYQMMTECMKEKLYEKYSDNQVLRDLVELIEIVEYEYQRADYWVDFSYCVRLGDLITLSRNGTGPYDDILAPIDYKINEYENENENESGIAIRGK